MDHLTGMFDLFEVNNNKRFQVYLAIKGPSRPSEQKETVLHFQMKPLPGQSTVAEEKGNSRTWAQEDTRCEEGDSKEEMISLWTQGSSDQVWDKQWDEQAKNNSWVLRRATLSKYYARMQDPSGRTSEDQKRSSPILSASSALQNL